LKDVEAGWPENPPPGLSMEGASRKKKGKISQLSITYWDNTGNLKGLAEWCVC